MTQKRKVQLVGILFLVLMVGYLSTGFFTVAPDEQAVIRRFGKIISSRLGPGMHYRIPWPVDQVNTLKTTAVMKTGVGFELVAEGQGQESPLGMELLTGDTNILNIAMVLQYVIQDPALFLFEVEDPQKLIKNVAASILTETVLNLPVDEVLTSGRLVIQDTVKQKTQEALDRYKSGIHVISANIMSINLDPAVVQAFQDVSNARADKERKINEAHSYVNNLLPKTRGEAQSLLLEAQGYKEKKISEATGEANRFKEFLKEYEKSPDVTRTRLYLEYMEKILSKVKKYYIDSDNGKIPVNLRLSTTP
jgi:membrane protease subunit HflK